jgi:hypothetical protein
VKLPAAIVRVVDLGEVMKRCVKDKMTRESALRQTRDDNGSLL